MTALLGTIRPSFLILTPACVALGIAMAYRSGADIGLFPVLLILIGGTAAHAGVNALNEYFDFRNGLDSRTDPTPFSGGSGTLPAHPELAPLALGVGLAGTAIALAMVLYFIGQWGWGLFPIGALGLLLVLAYTPWLTEQPWLCLIAPGLGFGPCMVMGAEAALTGRYSWAGFVVSLVPFFLVNNLLLLNQFPDVDADGSVGRNNLPILIGRPRSGQVYAAFFVLAGLVLAAAVAIGFLPLWGLMAFAGLAAGIPVLRTLAGHADDIPTLLPCMGYNVAASIATPALMALAGFLG